MNFSINLLSYSKIKSMTLYGSPLMLYSLLGIITTYCGRILLYKYSSLVSLGVYSFFLTLVIQINGLWSNFNRAWTPEIFSQFADAKDKAIENIKNIFFIACFSYLSLISIIVILGKIFLFKLIFNEKYFLNIHIFYILLLAPLFTGIYTTAYPFYYYKKKTTKILYISLATSILNIIITYFFVKYYSQNGAALSWLLISILNSFIYLLSFRRSMEIPLTMINLTLFIGILMIFNIVILFKTHSHIFFSLICIAGAILFFKVGGLNKKKYIIIESLQKIKEKLNLTV
jgi:O-antigen/teichoic acid export membrane protein